MGAGESQVDAFNTPSFLDVVSLRFRQLIEAGYFPSTPARFETIIAIDILDDYGAALDNAQSRFSGFFEAFFERAPLVGVR